MYTAFRRLGNSVAWGCVAYMASDTLCSVRKTPCNEKQKLGHPMAPEITCSDWLLLDRFAIWTNRIHRGDVVALRCVGCSWLPA